MKALAVAAPKRVAAFSNVPAAGETIPGFDFAGWFMVVAPVGTPPDVINKMNAAIDRAVKDQAVKDMAPKLGFDINPDGIGSPQAAGDFLKSQMELWAKTTKELGIEPQ